MTAPSPPLTVARFLRQAVALAVLMLLSLALYLTVLKLRGPAAQWNTQTQWDTRIPFRQEWIWMYLIPYLIGPAVAGMLTPATFRWYIRRGLVLIGVTLLIFVIWPTHTARPPVTDLGDSWTAQVYRHITEIDEPPANAAPSLHVSLTFLLALAAIRDFPRWWALAFGFAALVWLSTLLTWQHHLIDVATGIALAGMIAIPFGKRQTHT